MSKPEHDEISSYEWAVAALGMLLVLASIGFILYEELATSESPPDVHVSTESILRSGDGYLVAFKAENRGGSTAASLAIEGELSRGGVIVEMSEATIDYLPPRSHRSGGLFFSEDPSGGTIDLRASGFADP
jgi:uncharacterized protein (TIGR02588 family)